VPFRNALPGHVVVQPIARGKNPTSARRGFAAIPVPNRFHGRIPAYFGATLWPCKLLRFQQTSYRYRDFHW
jgi:hypothetical protein